MANCLSFAWAAYKFNDIKQYFSFRKSHWGKFPHFITWKEDGDMLMKLEYVPKSPKKRLIPPPCFDGKIVLTMYKRISVKESE